MNNLMIVTGILLAYIVNYLFTPFEAWRWMVGLVAVPAVLLLIGIAFMPESPRWLVKRGREEEAKRIMNITHDPKDIEMELAEMKQGKRRKRNDTRRAESQMDSPYASDWCRPCHFSAGCRH